MKICDLHTHSINSFDGRDSVEKMCKSAIDKGLYAIAITDHCEAAMIKEGRDCEFGYFDESIPKAIFETNLAKKKFADKIKVICGIELGEPMQDLECTKKALSYGEYDFILASLHNLNGEDDFYYIDYSKRDVSEILKLYFDELAETASFNDFDSLAHLTYPLRYIKERTGVYPDLSLYQDVIDDIYKILISKNKALEINTSGLFKPLGCTLPDELQLKRYKELGGKLITLGSDSHNCDAVAQGIEEGLKLAKKCGFDYYAIFEKRVPQLISIE